MPPTFKQALYGLLAIIILTGILYSYYIYSNQQQEPVQVRSYKIGYLANGTKDIENNNFKGFKDKIKTFGYEEGKNLTYYIETAPTKDDLPKAADVLNQKGLDIILVGSSSSGQALKGLKDLKTPVFFLSAGRPSDVVSNFQSPEGLITGIGEPTVEFTQKRLQFLKEILPNIKRVTTIVEKGHATSEAFKKNILEAAPKLGLEMIVIEIPTETPKEILNAVKKITLKNTDAYFACTCGSNEKYAKELVAYFLIQKIPAFNPEIEIGAKIGWLATYSNNRIKAGEMAAASVDKILKGAPISSIPVSFATDVLFEVNTKTANTIGVIIPQDILARANKIYNE